MNKIYLCSFASPDLERSKIRFINQAKEIEIYKDVKVYGYNDLVINKKKQINDFLKSNNKRLFGYACWKAFIISDFLKSLPENSIIQYSDIGCHINKFGKKRLIEYINICNQNNFLVFQYKLPDFTDEYNFKFQRYYEYQYTKKDLSDFLKIDYGVNILESEQIMSGIFFLKKNKFSIEILEEWEKVLKYNNLIDDSPSISKNHEDFIEHRHDQSAFSLICKKNKIFSLSASECEWAELNGKKTWEHLLNFPIQAKRDKKYNVFKRFLNRQKKKFNKIINYFKK